MKKIINYSQQKVDAEDIYNVSLALNDDYLTQGKRVVHFENNLSKFFKSKYCLAVSNGTAGLYLALKSLNLKKNDKIIISPFTFLSAASCCKLLNLKEKFIDIDTKTLNINIDLLEKELKKKIYKAIIVTDFGGLPADWERLNSLKKKYNIYLINDNCHSLGSKFKGDQGYAVKYADLAIQSFHPVKHITTGEGGCILTNIKKIHDKIKILRSLGIVKNKKRYWEYDLIDPSLNFRISDIQCALGSSQITKVKKRIEQRRKIAKKYDSFFSKYNYFKIPLDNKEYQNSYHLYPLRINFKKFGKTKTQLINYFFKNKIRLQVHYIPTYRMTIFNNWDKKKFPVCEEVFYSIVSIPMFDSLTKQQINKIIILFKKFFDLK